MRPPKWLTDVVALDYFKRHSKRLLAEGIIDEDDADTLAACADVWGQLRRVDPDADSKNAMRYNSLLKSWLALARQLGLLPRDRKRFNLATEADITDVLGQKLERR